MVVMTDCLENSSTDYDAHAIAELVRAYEERPNWTFVYLGAGHDTIQAAQNTASLMSFKVDNAMLWSADAASTRKSMRSLASATQARRRATALKSERFFADAGQSQADYQAGEPKRPKSPRAPRPTQIHRRGLGDVLRSSDRKKQV